MRMQAEIINTGAPASVPEQRDFTLQMTHRKQSEVAASATSLYTWRRKECEETNNRLKQLVGTIVAPFPLLLYNPNHVFFQNHLFRTERYVLSTFIFIIEMKTCKLC